jgi:hypothetical protein
MEVGGMVEEPKEDDTKAKPRSRARARARAKPKTTGQEPAAGGGGGEVPPSRHSEAPPSKAETASDFSSYQQLPLDSLNILLSRATTAEEKEAIVSCIAGKEAVVQCNMVYLPTESK